MLKYLITLTIAPLVNIHLKKINKDIILSELNNKVFSDINIKLELYTFTSCQNNVQFILKKTTINSCGSFFFSKKNHN